MRNRSDGRLLILGNGPSLKQEYFPLFKDVPCLGMNAAYRYWQRIGWYPDIYCCLDDQVVLSHADAIADMVENRLCKSFFLHPNLLQRFPSLANAPGVYFLPQLMKGEKNAALCKQHGLDHLPQDQFLSQKPGKLTTGSYALRFANFLGYRHLGLIGIDCRYTEIISEAKALGGIVLEIGATPKNNPNYFFDDYQVQGDRYNVPNPTVHQGNLHLQAFEVLRDDIERYKFDLRVEICTPESELYDQSVFPFAPLADFVAGPRLSAVFVPFVHADLDRLTKSLARWGRQEFAPYKVTPADPRVELHLAYNAAQDGAVEERITAEYHDAGLSRYFSGLHFHYSQLEGLRDLYTRKFEGPVGPEGYMAGPNNQFFDIIEKFSAGMSHIAVVEADAVPIRADWLAAVENIVSGSERFWICGSHYRGAAQIQSFSHINGNAIYNVGDPEFRRFFRDTFLPHFYDRVKSVPSLCYDIVLHDKFHPVFAGRSDKNLFSLWAKLAHRFRLSEYIVDVSHASDREPAALLSLEDARRLYPDAYLFHGAIAKIESAAPTAERRSSRALAPRRANSELTVAMLDPDALGQFGHYLAYDDQLNKALKPYAGFFHVLANRQLPDEISKGRSFFSPCLTDHSWAIGIPDSRTQEVDPFALKRFEEEVEAFVSGWRQRSGAKTIRLYMYCAGVPHAQAIARVLDRLPDVTAVVNLFYLPFQPIKSKGFVDHWVPALKVLAHDNRLVVTVPTDTLAHELRVMYGVELAVTPHPSPTIEDGVFSLLQKGELDSRKRHDPRLSVLFPGAPTVGKGSDLTVAAANHLAAAKQDARVIVRDLRRKGTSAQLAALYDTLDPRVETLKGQVSNEEFLNIFRSADIVVLPYMPDMFRYRNSGLLVDAIYCGKPVVAVKDTWLGNLVAKTGCGCVVDNPTPAAFANAIGEIAADLETFRRRAGIAAKAYFAGNSWDALARVVCTRGTVAAEAAATLPARTAAVGVAAPAPSSEATVDTRAARTAANEPTATGVGFPVESETLASLRMRIPDDQAALGEANRLFREGNYTAAMGIYLVLIERRPLRIYSENALMCARRLGMSSATNIEKLRQWHDDRSVLRSKTSTVQ